VWLVIFVIIFQPELRKALSQLSRALHLSHVEELGYIAAVQNAVERLSRKGLGALIAIERNVGLRNYLETGTRIEAAVSAELLETVFTPPSPLHDGAVIISDGELLAAGCVLPLSSNPELDRSLGTRHRAAVGLSEESDAIVIVVSEETRKISIAEGGQLTRGLQLGELKSRLSTLLHIQARKPKAAARATT
jgi:diadenylate cyclase